MSYLADEISRQMAVRQVDQVQLSELSGISQSQISKWLNSAQVSISEEQLQALATALSDVSADNASLVRAHLLDEKVGPGSELITIEIEAQTLHDRPRPRSKGERALHFLSEERLRNRELNDLLIDLARLLGAEQTSSSKLSPVEKQIVDLVAQANPPRRRSPRKRE